MHVAFAEVRDGDFEHEAVVGELRGGDLQGLSVEFFAAVFALEGVGIALAGELAEGGFFDGEGEGEAEAGFGEFELLHIERRLFRPHDLLQAKGAVSFAVPATV